MEEYFTDTPENYLSGYIDLFILILTSFMGLIFTPPRIPGHRIKVKNHLNAL